MVCSNATAALVVYIPGLTASMAGFTLGFSMQYSNIIFLSLRRYANIELEMNPIERAIESSRVEMEDQSCVNPPVAWPTTRRLEVEDLSAGYAPDLPPVLDGLRLVSWVRGWASSGARKQESRRSRWHCSGSSRRDRGVSALTISMYQRLNCTTFAAGWRLSCRTPCCSRERSGRFRICLTSTATKGFSTRWGACTSSTPTRQIPR